MQQPSFPWSWGIASCSPGNNWKKLCKTETQHVHATKSNWRYSKDISARYLASKAMSGERNTCLSNLHVFSCVLLRDLQFLGSLREAWRLHPSSLSSEVTTLNLDGVNGDTAVALHIWAQKHVWLTVWSGQIDARQIWSNCFAAN